MAVRSKLGIGKDDWIPGKPKTTLQGSGKHTKYAATSRNGKKKPIAVKVVNKKFLCIISNHHVSCYRYDTISTRTRRK